MDGLRWLLLFFGALVIAGVYYHSQRSKAEPDDSDDAHPRVEPRLANVAQTSAAPDSGEDESRLALSDDSESPESSDAPPNGGPQKIVTVRIVAQGNHSFAGDELILSLRGIGLRHGKFGIFHRYDGSDAQKTIFSAASLVEPGSFDLDNIKDQQIPGISLFLVLPGPIESTEAFDLMMAATHALGKALNGEVLDESGSTFSIQRERYLREEIIQFQHNNLNS